MRSHIEERAIVVAKYILEKNTTVRQTAKTFGVSKSTIHKDVTERLEEINPDLAKEVKTVLEKNKSERHIRGGMATKLKYEKDINKDVWVSTLCLRSIFTLAFIPRSSIFCLSSYPCVLISVLFKELHQLVKALV